jgi:hypothetical protein
MLTVEAFDIDTELPCAAGAFEGDAGDLGEADL